MAGPPSKKRRLSNGVSEASQVPAAVTQAFATFEELLKRGDASMSHFLNMRQAVLAAWSPAEAEATPKAEAAPVDPNEALLNEFKSEQLIVAIPKVKFTCPRGNMLVKFYASYLTIQSQAKADKKLDAPITALAYRDLAKSFICVEDERTAYFMLPMREEAAEIIYGKQKLTKFLF